MWQVGTSNSKYNYVLQHCIVTKITSVKMEEHVMKMPIINTRANAGLALSEDTVKHVSSSVAFRAGLRWVLLMLQH